MTAHGLNGEMTLPYLLKSNESIYLPSKHSPAAFNFTDHWGYRQIGKPLDKKNIDQNVHSVLRGKYERGGSPDSKGLSIL